MRIMTEKVGHRPKNERKAKFIVCQGSGNGLVCISYNERD
uniref:Uncharacterized protein n=1 Tax=Arundo donax TaxID=35708 RepID=A0A0A8Y703_ARUDO